MPLDTDGRWGSTSFEFRLASNPVLDDNAGHTLVDNRGLFVLHAVLLRTGKVLCFCGRVESSFYAARSYVFDPKGPTDQRLRAIRFPAGMDLFCCHYVQIPDGRILVVGGSDTDFRHHGSVGAKNICIFYPDTEEWRMSRRGGVPNLLIQGRWYPTPVRLPDGRVMVVSGRPEHTSSSVIADKVEILSQGAGSTRDWHSTELTTASVTLPIYPGLHLAPNGRVYFTHTTWGQEVPDPDTMSIEVTAGATWTRHPNQPTQRRREEGMSVLLPLVPNSVPPYKGKILVVGGSLAVKVDGVTVFTPPPGPDPPAPPALFDSIHTSTDPFNAEILDTSVSPPTWSPAHGSPMARGRVNGHCVLLPDGTVLILGGHDGYKWQASSRGTTPSLMAEIFTEASGFHLAGDPAAVTPNQLREPRMYHSVALLLPDGRVFVAGGANPNVGEPTLPWPADWGGVPAVGERVNDLTYGPYAPDPDPNNNLGYFGIARNLKTFEFYEPPYYFKPDRASQPTISNDGVRRGGIPTNRIRYGETFTVRSPQAASIVKVVLMRPGAPTHHTDTEQRYIQMTSTPGPTEVTVTAVSDPKIAPPGYYMLWIVDNHDRPCQEAKFIHLVV